MTDDFDNLFIRTVHVLWRDIKMKNIFFAITVGKIYDFNPTLLFLTKYAIQGTIILTLL